MKLKITFKEWDYTCGDGCCTTFGTKLYLNDKELDVVLFGHLKDDSSYYLNEFPTWKFVDVAIEKKELVINATDIRLAMFNNDIEYVRNQVPPLVFKWLMDWQTSEKYVNIIKEYENDRLVKKQYEGLKYEMPFITTDAIIISNGKILLTKTKTK
jgi:bifunctional NMN adenylyltransferase/nudix hydrolase